MKSSTGCGHTDLTNSLYIIDLETYPSTAVPTDLLQDRFLEVGSNFCSFECPTRWSKLQAERKRIVRARSTEDSHNALEGLGFMSGRDINARLDAFESNSVCRHRREGVVVECNTEESPHGLQKRSGLAGTLQRTNPAKSGLKPIKVGRTYKTQPTPVSSPAVHGQSV